MPALAEIFACPRCRADAPTVEDDTVTCTNCGRRYPVVSDIPRFLEELPEGLDQIQRVFDFEHRRYDDSWYTRFEPRLVHLFLEDAELPAEFFRGKRALDAGCGSGRWTYALAKLGADVAGFDLTSGGLEAAHAELAANGSGPLLCQANIFSPPFRPASFDFVMSWGVMHHTPDTKRAFDAIAPLVSPGGTLYVMVYERYRGPRRLGTAALRAIVRRLPDERRYRFCRRLVIENPWLHGVLARFLTVGRYDPANPDIDPTTIQFGLYDAYSPRYNHLHTRTEVAGWFRAAGYENVTVLDTPPGTTVKVQGRKA
jgi:2-polyprenyl-3-methyl-5-hydroxy-6-metoxy-1,4-benzoquinol methylase